MLEFDGTYLMLQPAYRKRNFDRKDGVGCGAQCKGTSRGRPRHLTVCHENLRMGFPMFRPFVMYNEIDGVGGSLTEYGINLKLGTVSSDRLKPSYDIKTLGSGLDKIKHAPSANNNPAKCSPSERT